MSVSQLRTSSAQGPSPPWPGGKSPLVLKTRLGRPEGQDLVLFGPEKPGMMLHAGVFVFVLT